MAIITGEDNIDDVAQWLEDTAGSFDFTRPGDDGSIGKDMANATAQGIIDRTVDQQKRPDGQGLRALNPKYRRRKQRKYHVETILVRTGQMMSLQSVLGSVDIAPEEVTLSYGTGEPPSSSGTGYISEQDKEVTDTQKAEWMTETDRPFYELDEEIAATVRDVAGEGLSKHLESEGTA